jgi:murein DD-endopeptidase MepM/ murein hydrolase activator NlpD
MEMAKKTRFTRMLIDANGLAPQSFNAWVFQPGMLFGSPDKWWGDFGRRDFPHEGLDFALYQDDAGKIRSLDQGTRIPAMSAGVVRSIFSDYLGQAIVVEQVDVEKEGSRRISIYAHTVPLTGVHPGTIIDEGDVIATIADTSRSKVTIRPHLHYTLGQLLGAVVYEQFVWNCMRDPHRVDLLDPLILLDCPHRILASPVVSKSPWQTGE